MRDFPGSLTLQYRGALGSQAIGAHRRVAQQPQAVTATIAWREYALQMSIPGGTVSFNAGVSLSLQKGVVTAPLDAVKCVFVDNTAVDRPVFLQCSDTGHVISVPDGFSGWYPLITFGQDFTLYTDNIIPLRDGNQKTRLIFANVPFDTFGQPELNRAQALYRASGSSQYVTPVIGDKIVAKTVEINTSESINGPGPHTLSTELVAANPNSTKIITAIEIKNLQIVFSTGVTAFHEIVVRPGTLSGQNELCRLKYAVGTQQSLVNANPLKVDNLQVSLEGSLPLNVADVITAPGAGSTQSIYTTSRNPIVKMDIIIVYAEIIQPIFT